ncbi:MAG: branched-chain amino acid transport system II carrier protein [Candidatus Dependentiae bacterium]|nr:branched-chain amino acid transport system II carrier protein [Candidatus Dependentiae bacterium]
MKNPLQSYTVTTGLAVFSMLFGAGNLMYPLVVGMTAGSQLGIGIAGFFLTAVCIPLAGLIGMILFDGNYEQFFNRLGKIPGGILIWICMMIIGPIIAIPRITTLSHTMIAPFIPWNFLQVITPLSSCVFSIIFLGITFLATYRENKIVDILGNVISPALLVSLIIIITKGIFSASYLTPNTNPPFEIFKSSLMTGYETLDLFGALFFSAIVLNILKKTLGQQLAQKPRLLAWVGLKSGILGVTLLGLVYIGMSILGAYHGHGLEGANAGELFRGIAFNVLGSYGAFIIATAVLMACLSTAIALSAVVAEYTQFTLLHNHLSFSTCLGLTLLACLPLSIFGLGHVLKLTGGPITYVGYPILITITFCNIAYKLFDFKPIVIPAIITFVAALISYLY